MTTRDTTHLTDITKMKSEPDGSFKRPASVFRSFVEEGGEFAPEKGTCFEWIVLYAFIQPSADRYHLYVSYGCRMPFSLGWRRMNVELL
jgi:putative glutathione S-transferase